MSPNGDSRMQCITFLWTLCSCLAGLTPLVQDARAQDCVDLRDYPRISFEASASGVLQLLSFGELVLVLGEDRQLRILDSQQPEADPIGQYQAGSNLTAMALDVDRLAISSQIGVLLLDLQDPSQPDSLGLVLLPFSPNRLVLEGDRLAVGSFNQGLVYCNIEDPSQPDVIWTSPEISFNAGLVPTTDGLAALDLMGLLQFYELGEDSLLTRGSLPEIGLANGLVAFGDTLAVNGVDGTILVDARNPDAPAVIGSLDENNWRAARREGSFLLLLDPASLRVLDFQDALNPVARLRVGVNSGRDLLQVDGALWLASADNLLGLENLDAPPLEPSSGVTLPGQLQSLSVYGDYYLAARTAVDGIGLSVFDLSTPGFPVEVGSAFGFSNASQVVTARNHAYLPTTQGVRIVDLEFPWTPLYAGDFRDGESQLQLAAGDSTLYVLDSEDLLHVYSLEDPLAPAFRGSLALEHNPTTIRVCGQRLYVPSAGLGLQILDLSDPWSPGLLGAHEILSPQFDLLCEGERVWIGCREEGLLCVDVGDPANPQRLSSTPMAGFFLDADRIGNTLYVAGGEAGVAVYDVGDPAAPVRIGNLFHQGYCRAVIAEADRVLGAWSTEGLQLFPPQCDDSVDLLPPAAPASFALHAPAPNPFNPQTILRYRLEKPMSVQFHVYSVTGARVASRNAGVQAAGDHSWTYRGQGLASGLYLISLQTPAGAQTRKALLLK